MYMVNGKLYKVCTQYFIQYYYSNLYTVSTCTHIILENEIISAIYNMYDVPIRDILGLVY
jgi:hypothetical protein